MAQRSKDFENPLDLLHVDEWLEVLERLNDIRDLINLGHTCIFFQNLLQNYRINEKGSALEILQFVEVVPLILKWLPSNDICTLRLVCRRIKLSIDKFLEDEVRLVPYNNLELYPSLLPPTTLDWPLQTSHEWRHLKLRSGQFHGVNVLDVGFLQSLKNAMSEASGDDKFIGKKMTINIYEIFLRKWSSDACTAFENGEISFDEYIRIGDKPTPEERRLAKLDEYNLLEASIQFFNMFPQHLTHVDIKMEHLWTYKEVYNLTRRLIGSLTNLKVLSTNYPCHPDEEEDEDGEHQLLPLPDRPSLESIKISVSYKMAYPEHFARNISAKYGDHLRSLEISLADDTLFMDNVDEDGWNDGQPYNFPCLHEFAVKLVAGPLLFLTKMNAPQLKVLHISLFDYDAGWLTAGNVVEVIRVILSFPSISQLKLDAFSDYYEGSREVVQELERVVGKVEEWQHQNLKHVTVKSGKEDIFNVPLLFWIVFCPQLEVLQVVGFEPSDFEPSFRGRDDDLDLLLARRFEESQMWEWETLAVVKWKEIGGYRLWMDTRPVSQPYVCFRPEKQGPK